MKTWYERGECEHGCCSPEEVYRHTSDAIDEPGWMVISVLGEHGDPSAPPWAYTIGLVQRFGHPEFTVVGLDTESSHGLLNWLGFEVKNGRRFTSDTPATIDILGLPARLVDVHPSYWESDWFNQWHGYYESLGYGPGLPTAIQVLWPDNGGRFPDEAGAEELQRCQPLLTRPPRSAN